VRETFTRWGQGFIDLELFATEPREEAAARLRELLDSGLLEQPLFEIAQARGLGETPQRVRLKGVLELLDKDYDAVILGEPGCGKTTTLQRLALESAERVQRGQEKARIPVFLRLAAWDGGPLEEFVTQSVGDPLAPGLPGLLETGRLLLLFDALNEMPRADEGDYRRRVQAWREFRAGHSDNRFLVTCRRLDYTETLPLQQVEIEPFDAGRVEAFLRRFPDGDRLLAALAERGYALEEWGNPLLLKVLYLVVRTGQFPDNRG
jgi:predicted NACHT family NTPase